MWTLTREQVAFIVHQVEISNLQQVCGFAIVIFDLKTNSGAFRHQAFIRESNESKFDSVTPHTLFLTQTQQCHYNKGI